MQNTKNTKGELKLLPVLIGAVVGVLLLVYGGKSGSVNDADTLSVSQTAVYDEARYEEELVSKIESICKRVKGSGDVSVAVTLDGSYRAIYAQNLADGSNSKKEYFLMGSGSSEKALLLGYSPPEILGVAIVCDGGGNSGVKAEIISLVSALLDLPTNKIYVAASKN